MIDIKELLFRYKATEDLFYRLNLNIKAGIICGLLGKNGVGKTTLLRLISGLLFPQQGTCKVLGYEPRKRVVQFLQDIYFIPEEFYVPAITIRSYVGLFSPFYEKFSRQDFLRFLKEFELSQHKKLTTLSYGQKKKFLIAFALATNCRLLLLDEPTNGLDIPSKSQFRRLLASSLSADRIIIISTHQVRDLQNLLDTVIILEDGKIIFNQTIYDVAKKLNFVQQPSLQTEEPIIYAEKILGGFLVVRENESGIDSGAEIDLEVLFNAVLSNKEKIGVLF